MDVTECTKNHAGGNRQPEQDYSDVRMYQMVSSPFDPVRCFTLYKSKLHDENSFLFAKKELVDARQKPGMDGRLLGKTQSLPS
ncbi:MAG: hypothetical protein AAFY76_25405 [Cyanobacteria bacterium J06649_11]